MKGTALITGASSGIGRATAVALSDIGINLVICGRQQDALTDLKRELDSKVEVTTLNFDVRNKQEVNSALERLLKKGSEIEILINNAGNAHGLDSFEKGDIRDWDAMIDINLKGLLYVSQAIIPGMVNRRRGHIINIGSLAGKEVYPKGAVYCASKHAVDAITQGMRLDLHSYGIRVGAVNPGLVETNFSKVRFKGDDQRAETVYRGYSPLQANDIADIITFIVTRPSHVNIADLLVLPTDQANSVSVNKS